MSTVIVVGAGANRSTETGQPIRSGDLVHGLEDPEFPPMPSGDGPVHVDRDGWRVVWR